MDTVEVEIFSKGNVRGLASQDVAKKYYTLDENEREKLIQVFIRDVELVGWSCEDRRMAGWVGDAKGVKINFSQEVDFEKNERFVQFRFVELDISIYE
ncbi:MAG: hypothetical protein LBJ75_02880 [Puniceicoccales bacterium]|jgi:hypothetical protein|nr:hypothetical protein [Puniceicoccales bacterium]